MYTSYNINEIVMVKLTPKGKEYLKAYLNEIWEELCEHSVNRPEESLKETFYRGFCNDDNTFRAQLWEMMSIFGPKCYMGADQMFEENQIHVNVGCDGCD